MNNLSLNETIENVGGLEFFFKHLGIYLPKPIKIQKFLKLERSVPDFIRSKSKTSAVVQQLEKTTIKVVKRIFN